MTIKCDECKKLYGEREGFYIFNNFAGVTINFCGEKCMKKYLEYIGGR